MKLRRNYFKRLFSILMSVILIACAVPISGILPVTAASYNTGEYVIWDLNPNRITSEIGGDVTVKPSHFTEFAYQSAVKAEENGESYISASFTSHGGAYIAMIKSGLSLNTSENFRGWLNDYNVLKKLAPYLTFKADVRTSAENITAYTALYQPYHKIGSVGNIKLSTTWTSYEGELNIADFTSETLPAWYDSYFAFSIWSTAAAPTVDAPVTVDIKNARIVINESYRNTVNDILSELGSSLTFNQLIEFDKESEYSQNPERTYVIWDADTNRSITTPDKFTITGYGAGHTVSRSEENGEAYFTSNIQKQGFVQAAVFSNGLTSAVSGFAWMNNVKILNALYPYITVSYDVRSSTATNFYLRGYNKSTSAPGNSYAWSITQKITQTDTWIHNEVPVSAGATSATSTLSWADGIIGWDLYGASVLPATVDVKNIKITVKESDRHAIDAAFAAADTDNDYSFDDIIAYDKQSAYSENLNLYEEYVVLDSNPDRLASEVGETVSVEPSQIGGVDFQTAVKAEENGESYTSVSFENSGAAYKAILDTGLTYHLLPWLNDGKTIDAIAPYLQISFDYRSSATVQSYVRFYQPYGLVGQVNTTKGPKMVAGNSWQTYTSPKGAIEMNGNFDTWYSAYIGIDTYTSPATAATIDIKNITLKLTEIDRDDINTALAKSGSTYTFDDIITFDGNSLYSDDYYGVSIEDTVGGEITVDGLTISNPHELIRAKAGKEYTVNVKCENGHTVSALTVLDVDNNAVETVRTGYTTYKFVMPDSAVTVSADIVLAEYDINGDGVTDNADVSEYKTKVLNNDIMNLADYNNDSMVNVQDVAVFRMLVLAELSAYSVGVETEHPGVVDMDAYYTLVVKEGSNVISVDDLTITSNHIDVEFNGFEVKVPYSVRNSNVSLIITVTSNSDTDKSGFYVFDFAKFTENATLNEDFQ